MKRRFFPLIWTFGYCFGQTEPPVYEIPYQAETVLESMAEAEEEFNPTPIYPESPVSLKTPDIRNLYEFGLISHTQLHDLSNHISTYGPPIHIAELQLITSFSKSDIRRIAPYVQLTHSLIPQNRNSLDSEHKGFWISRLQRTFERSAGYERKDEQPPAYMGDANSYYQRMSYTYRNLIEVGWVAEKDAGEGFFTPDQPQGFDFHSGFLLFSIPNLVERVIVGDYQVSFGQGLTYSSGRGIGKSSEVLLTEQPSSMLRPFKSVNEMQSLRGIGMGLQIKNLRGTVFWSDRKIDATYREKDASLLISSLYTSGLHRTELERSKKYNTRRQIGGMELLYHQRTFQLGYVTVLQKMSSPFLQDDLLQNHFDIPNASRQLHGLHGSTGHGSWKLFGEFSTGFGGQHAFIGGLGITPDPAVSFNLNFRSFARSFQPISSAAFGQFSQNSNESGVYVSMRFTPFRRLVLSTFVDLFKSPWVRSNPSGPSHGSDQFVSFIWKPVRHVEWVLRYRRRKDLQDVLYEGNHLDKLHERIRRNVRLQLTSAVIEALRLRFRFEWNQVGHANNLSTGHLLFAEIKHKKTGSPFSVLFRFTVFSTTDYDSRIYAYEQNVLYAYSIPAYSGKGYRSFLVLQLRAGRRINWWLKWSRTTHPGQVSSGSGNETIKGPHRTNLTLQCRLKL